MNAIIESMNAWGFRFAAFALPMLLQSAVLIALFFLLDFAVRKRVRATIRYAFWMLALVKLALPPSLASPTGAAYWLPAESAGRYFLEAPGSSAVPGRLVINTSHKPLSTVRSVVALESDLPGLTWQADFFAVWLSVALATGAWVVWRLRFVVVVLRQSAEAPEEWRTLVESCRRQLGIKRVIPVRCAAIGSPVICGVFRPVILIASTLAENLGESDMRSVLLHELAHFKRGDLWVNHAQILLQILYWYNPLLWLANASIRRAREQAADEMVLVELGGAAQEYSATLLHVAKLGLRRPAAALGLMGILEPGHGLTQRILHIMNRPLPRSARIGARGLAAVLLSALVALPMACRSKAEPALRPQAGRSAGNSVTETSMRLIHKILLQHIGPATVSNVLIRTNIASQEGKGYSPDQVDKDVKSIWTTGLFRLVRAYDTNTLYGVDLAFVVQERPVITNIQIVGNKIISKGALQRALSCKVGQSLDDFKLYEDSQRIGDLYRKLGYPKVTVNLLPPVIDEKAGRASVTIEINEKLSSASETNRVDQVADQAIKQDIQERFGGNRDLLIKKLHANGQTYASYRKLKWERVSAYTLIDGQ